MYKKEITDKWEGLDDLDSLEYKPSVKGFDTYQEMQSIGAELTLWIDPEVLCTLGFIDLTFYYGNLFAVSKSRDSIFINQLPALKQMIDIFYGTPFSLNIRKVDKLEFVRYEVTIPRVFTNSFSELMVFTKLLDECLHQMNESVACD